MNWNYPGNMRDSHKHNIWVKEARYKKVRFIGFQIHAIQKLAKLSSQKSGFLGDILILREQEGDFRGAGCLSGPMTTYQFEDLLLGLT